MVGIVAIELRFGQQVAAESVRNGSDRPEHCRVAIRARTESKNGNLCGVRGKVHVLSAPTPGANIVRTVSNW